jgi:hypothetical protein
MQTLLSMSDLGRLLSMSRRSIMRYMSTGALKSVYLRSPSGAGRPVIRFRASDVETAFPELRETPCSGPAQGYDARVARATRKGG